MCETGINGCSIAIYQDYNVPPLLLMTGIIENIWKVIRKFLSLAHICKICNHFPNLLCKLFGDKNMENYFLGCCNKTLVKTAGHSLFSSGQDLVVNEIVT